MKKDRLEAINDRLQLIDCDVRDTKGRVATIGKTANEIEYVVKELAGVIDGVPPDRIRCKCGEWMAARPPRTANHFRPTRSKR